MTPKEIADKIQKFISGFDNLVSNTFEAATRNLATEIEHRVFEQHTDINGNKMGQYSSKPMLVGAKSFVNKTKSDAFFAAIRSKEKAGRKTDGFESGWRRKNGKNLYLIQGGYHELRETQGLQANEIDFQYTHEFELHGIETNFENAYQVKFGNLLSQKKGRGFEKKHNEKVFYPSAKESKRAAEYIGDKIIGGLQECFS